MSQDLAMGGTAVLEGKRQEVEAELQASILPDFLHLYIQKRRSEHKNSERSRPLRNVLVSIER